MKKKNLEMKSIIKNIIKIKFNPEESEYFANKIVERADISIWFSKTKIKSIKYFINLFI